MNLDPKNILPKAEEVKKFIVFFYFIGILGFLIPHLRIYFIVITPFAIVLSTFLLAIYHSRYFKRDVFVFLVIFALGYFIEAIGVNTGLIFGNYCYGNALGIKLFNTPLLIGLNWLFLIYTSTSISERITNKTILQIIIAPTLLLPYDLILEQLAPKMEMWRWINVSVPVRNYIAWWIIAFAFTCFLKLFKINTKNPLATLLFICQFVFFILLYFVFIIVK